jgi:hypothetical protein
VNGLIDATSVTGTQPMACNPTEFREEVSKSLDRFCTWLEKCGGISYDPYDLSGTRYGRWARRLYYAKHPLAIGFNAPLILLEIAAPSLRALFVKKDHYATADAQLALGFLNLYRASEGPQKERSLEQAHHLSRELLKQSIPGYRGHCWGYPFDWQNVNGLMPKGTPHITATPYCYEVFSQLFDITGDEEYLEVARSIAAFVCYDLNDAPHGQDGAASSYTPHDHSKVVNASAYRAFVMFDAGRRFQNEEYLEKAWRNLHFMLETQEENGAWLYAIDNPPEAFIDHFHTCFVLKNLYKLNQYLKHEDVRRAIEKGYSYYRHNLFDQQDNPKLYSIAPRLEIIRLEMYNFAEAISLGTLLRNEIPEAFDLARNLAKRIIRNYQLPAGYWVTRIYSGNLRHSVPFLRWPQAQLFLSLTNLLVALTRGPADIEGEAVEKATGAGGERQPVSTSVPR